MATSKLTKAGQLNNLLRRIAEATNQYVSRKEAMLAGADFFLYMEYAAIYGGYRVVNVKIENGAHYGALNQSSCCSNRSFKEMESFLTGVLAGIDTYKFHCRKEETVG